MVSWDVISSRDMWPHMWDHHIIIKHHLIAIINSEENLKSACWYIKVEESR